MLVLPLYLSVAVKQSWSGRNGSPACRRHAADTTARADFMLQQPGFFSGVRLYQNRLPVISQPVNRERGNAAERSSQFLPESNFLQPTQQGEHSSLHWVTGAYMTTSTDTYTIQYFCIYKGRLEDRFYAYTYYI